MSIQMKHPAKSKTVWTNLLSAMAIEALANLPMLQPHLPDDYYAYAFYTLAIVNVGLRAVTHQPLRLRPPENVQ